MTERETVVILFSGRCRILLLVLCFWALPAIASPPPTLDHVLIVSIDALHPSALETEAAPHIRRLMQKGNYSLRGKSTHPPKTLVAHTAMLTGLAPEVSGLFSNDWQTGDPLVSVPTIFNTAKANGYRTAFFYSKEKLGYLAGAAIDVHQWSPDNAIDRAEAFIKTEGRHFVFLHISGLDEVGPENGWLSPEYLEELSYIDEFLSPLLETLLRRSHLLVIITSDHGGHGREHGTDHPEDARIPFVVYSDMVNTAPYEDFPYSVTNLKPLIDAIIAP